MDDEAPKGGRAANGAPRPRPRWGRRTPYGIRRDGPNHDYDQGSYAEHPRATYAALDLGTNNCRLLIARPTADGFASSMHSPASFVSARG
jgi:exopolyphosphatase/guanosine-5'-triphosphate,3'-diphosphate pyrophosphatase